MSPSELEDRLTILENFLKRVLNQTDREELDKRLYENMLLHQYDNWGDDL